MVHGFKENPARRRRPTARDDAPRVRSRQAHASVASAEVCSVKRHKSSDSPNITEQGEAILHLS